MVESTKQRRVSHACITFAPRPPPNTHTHARTHARTIHPTPLLPLPPLRRFWLSLQLNFFVVLLLAFASWTLITFVFGLVFMIPFNVHNSTEHLNYETFTGADHNPNMTLAAAFFFAVQSLSTVGYGCVLLC